MNRPASIFFLLYLGAVVYLSLFPFDFLPYARSTMLYWVEGASRRVLWDMLLNFLFYVPLGTAAVLALGRSVPSWTASVLFATLLSLAIEVAQLFTPTRFGNLRDVAANSCGAIMGASAAGWLMDPRIARRIPPLLQSAPWKIPAVAVLFLILWMLWQAFPFVPYVSLYLLSQTWERLRQMEWTSLATGIAAGRSFFGFYVLALAAGTQSRWLAVAFLVLPAQAILVSHTFSAPATAGAVAGWAAASTLKAPRFAAAALLAWLAVEEFQPFYFTVEPGTFGWAPFESWFASGAGANYPVFFSKTFLYTSVVWALRRCGLGWTLSLLVPAAILAGGEWTQRYADGRTPETTDLVLLAAGAALLKLTGGGVPASGANSGVRAHS